MADDAGSVKVVVQIRRARARDFVNILSCLERSIQEATVAYAPINDAKLLQWIMDCKRDGEVLVADCSRQIVGVLGLMARHWPWSDEKYIGGEFFFVTKNFRKHGTADALLNAAGHFADEHSMRLVIGFSGGKDSSLKDRWLSIRGWHYCGGSFLRMPEPKNGNENAVNS